ncbi:hypothetical protein [Mycobacterium sp.]|jgi:hypothetical protein|uniref:hypothetical protein n=1 Tax=Mycobacterium sp. TaxID=1785 RepID=UPI00261E811A|nr:hypothetical protein [Mycobacterium sp.]
MPDDATYGALAVRSRRQLLDVLRAAEHQLDIPTLVCGLHLGLLQETVEQASAGTVSAELSPFARPDLCIADLTTVSHRVPA